MSEYKFKTQQIIFLVLTVLFIGGPILLLFLRYNRGTNLIGTMPPKKRGYTDESKFNPTHVVNIEVYGGYIKVRTRPMTTSEYQLANSSTKESDKLNDKIVIGYLSNGTVVELIEQKNISFKIRYKVYGKIIEGYIAISYQNKPTLYPLGKSVKY